MAEGKNSFILYTDLHHTVKHLSTEQAGELFKIILSYVNDENPEVENPLLKIAFEPIKQQLKRDLKKYSVKIDKKSRAGIIGNLKRWDEDTYKLYDKGLITLEEAQSIAENRKASQCDNGIAKIAVNDSVNDNVSDINTNVFKSYDKKDFFSDWNELRTKHLNKPSFVKSFSNYDLSEFKMLKETLQ